MLLRLNRISVMPTALVFSVLHAVIGLVFGAIVTIGVLFNPENEGIWGLGAWAIFVLPIVNAVLGFLTGSFVAGSYNLIVQWLGKGIELDFDHLDSVSLKS